ncbi:MAG: ankyrin repeat domain-containing protein [Alphaproteobacteria bacterium]|nr:ankyrin repeat domain-containing protein [Alphaproteobacteria bacterium]
MQDDDKKRGTALLEVLGRQDGDDAVALRFIAEGVPAFALDDALAFAVDKGSMAVTQALLAAGADAGYCYPGSGDGLLVQAVLGENASLDIAALLIEKGADINAGNTFGNTLLMRAVLLGAGADKMQWILEAGADVNAVNYHGRTALIHAVTMTAADEGAVVDLLLKAGAQAAHKDEGQRTAAHYAAEFNKPSLAALLDGAAVRQAFQEADARGAPVRRKIHRRPSGAALK